ncbi:MAG: hypothetical protein ACJAXA_001205 [Candidatus Aldehydirespiratoraceae bacterium]|jgi:hypothetical protein
MNDCRNRSVRESIMDELNFEPEDGALERRTFIKRMALVTGALALPAVASFSLASASDQPSLRLAGPLGIGSNPGCGGNTGNGGNTGCGGNTTTAPSTTTTSTTGPTTTTTVPTTTTTTPPPAGVLPETD